MGAKDIKAKEYLADNTRFADLCNAVLFDGEQVISPESLRESDAAEVLSIRENGNDKVNIQRMRDLLKNAVIKFTGNEYIVLIGVENQAKIHYAAAVKSMLYDAVNYGAQVKAIGKKHKKNRDNCSEDEYLSGFHKGDRLIPIITITVYWRSGRWDGAVCGVVRMGRRYNASEDEMLDMIISETKMDRDKARKSMEMAMKAVR